VQPPTTRIARGLSPAASNCRRLASIRFKCRRANGRVAGRALGEKQHGVPGPHRVAVKDLAKQLPSIAELGLEAGQQLFAHGVAAGADAGTDGGNQVFGREPNSSLMRPTPASTIRSRSAPAGMEGRHHSPLAVGHQHGNAVGGLDAEQQAGLVGHQAIPFTGPFAGRVASAR